MLTSQKYADTTNQRFLSGELAVGFISIPLTLRRRKRTDPEVIGRASLLSEVVRVPITRGRRPVQGRFHVSPPAPVVRVIGRGQLISGRVDSTLAGHSARCRGFPSCTKAELFTRQVFICVPASQCQGSHSCYSQPTSSLPTFPRFKCQETLPSFQAFGHTFSRPRLEAGGQAHQICCHIDIPGFHWTV